jgi:hypothetical protein
MRRQKLGFLAPGVGAFVISLALMQASAIFPEYGESPILVGVGFLLFFFSLGYIMIKVLGISHTGP